jgi:hypothetical protein
MEGLEDVCWAALLYIDDRLWFSNECPCRPLKLFSINHEWGVNALNFLYLRNMADLHNVVHFNMDSVVESGFIYAAKALGSSTMKVGLTKQRDPIQYIQSRYAFALECFCLMGVTDANMAEKIAFKILKPWHISHEIFEALDWEPVQAAFEKTAYLVASKDRCLEFCAKNGIEQVKPNKKNKDFPYFEDFIL